MQMKVEDKRFLIIFHSFFYIDNIKGYEDDVMINKLLKKDFNLKRFLMYLPIRILIIFILISLLTTEHAQVYLSFPQIKQALSPIKSEVFLDWMSQESPYIKTVLPKNYEPINLSKLSFERLTHIELNDPRSLLGNELPGFSIYDTNIFVAGEGTNFSNVPQESPPPPEYIMKDSGKKTENNDDQNEKNGQVFIYSTHSWESYLPLLGLTGDPDINKAASPDKNVHNVDGWLQEDLQKKGIKTVIDKTNIGNILKQKGWGYPQSYQASRPILQKAVSSGKDYKLFIDVHRDSSRGNLTTVTINNKKYARMTFVIGEENPNYEKNLEMAKNLNQYLVKNYPGLSRGVFGKKGAGNNGVYNQDLSPHAILIEIGGVDNNEQELKRTVQALANMINDYFNKNNDKEPASKPKD